MQAPRLISLVLLLVLEGSVSAHAEPLPVGAPPLLGSSLLFQNSLTATQESRRAPDLLMRDQWEEFWSQLWRSDEPAKRIQDLGGNSTLLRVSWRELETEPGKLDPAKLGLLRALIQSIRKNHPEHRFVVSLSSGDEPLWFIDRGGWLSPEAPRLFFEYARGVFESVGEGVQDWLLLEEPMSRALGPLLTAEPGTAPETLLADAFEIAFQLARAHRITASYIKLKQGRNTTSPHGTIGVAIRAHHYVAGPTLSTDPSLSPRVAEIAYLAHWAWLHGVLSGNLRLKLSLLRPTPRTIELERPLPKSDLPPWDSGPLLDWVGLNLGTRLELYPSAQGDLGVEVRFPEGMIQDDQGWPVAPEDHAEILREAETQTSLPLWITQAGLLDGSGSRQLDFLQRQWAVLSPFFTAAPRRVEAYFFRTLYSTPETQGLVACQIPPLPALGPPAPRGSDSHLQCAPERTFHFLQTQFQSFGT